MRLLITGPKVSFLTFLVALLVVIPGCRDTPEEPVPDPSVSPTVPPTPTPRVRLSTLDPPQYNPEIGITLTGLPSGHVITANEDLWIEVYDNARIRIQYTFLALPKEANGVSLADLGAFEGLLHSLKDGRAESDGTMKTALGKARWASGIYVEDDERLIDLRVFAPHPSGSGTLVVYSTCPPGMASVEERLEVIRELLSNVS